jgi:peptide chain release factor 1
MKMKEKLKEVLKNYEELTVKLSNPEVIKDQEKFKQLAKALAEVEPLAKKISELEAVKESKREAEELLKAEKDSQMVAWLQEELKELTAKETVLNEELRRLMLPKDPNDSKDVIVEIRAGAGGQEASLFAADLFRMYSRYAERQGFKTEIMSSSPSELGGFKEIIFAVKGKGAYSRLKFESGVHRVQRVPVTESSGRIHTSTATVAVLPEAEEIEVEINPQDLRVDIFRSSGPGGQSVNTTDSAVRITHLPTGIVVHCQEERSQLQNKERALRILRARLYEKELLEQQRELAQARKMQVGTGDRSERIRTYNFPQGRVTDHRIGLTLYNLEAILDGEINELIEALVAADQSERLKEVV